MNALRLLALAACAASSSFASTVVLEDDFSGSSVDSSKWTIINPLAGSLVTQNEGLLHTTGRGTLATVAGISTPYTLAGSFKSSSPDEVFTITLRSNLVATTPYFERQGIAVRFSINSDNLEIGTFDEANTFTQLQQVNYSFYDGTSYAFEITDNGFDIAVSIYDTLVASASSSLTLGNQIAFYSREFSYTNSSLNHVTITSSAIPEPASFAGLAGLAVLGLVATRRRRAA